MPSGLKMRCAVPSITSVWCFAPLTAISARLSPLRQLSEREARIGLLAGRGAGAELMQAAQRWAALRELTTLRVATQMGNTAALKRYILSGANVESTAYWLYR